MADERSEHENPTAPRSAEEELRSGGQPTTAGSGPGGQPTGLQQPRGVPSMTEGGVAGVGSGGSLATGGVGGFVDSGGGLTGATEGLGGVGQIGHGAGRPGQTIRPGESGQPGVEVGPEGLHLQDPPGVPEKQRQVQDTSWDDTLHAGRRGGPGEDEPRSGLETGSGPGSDQH